MLLGNTVKFAEVTLRLVPEILNAVDMVFAVGKELGVVDPPMPEAGNIEGIVAGEGITIDDGVRHDPLLQDGQQGRRLGIGDDHRIDLCMAKILGQAGRK